MKIRILILSIIWLFLHTFNTLGSISFNFTENFSTTTFNDPIKTGNELMKTFDGRWAWEE